MKVRAITCFFDPCLNEPASTLHQLGQLCQRLKHRLQDAGIEVQTCRVATTPFPLWLDLTDEHQAVQHIRDLEEEALSRGFDYLASGRHCLLIPTHTP